MVTPGRFSQHSNMVNQARLKILGCQQQHIRTVLEDAQSRLHELSRDPQKYRETVRGLIIQVWRCCDSRCRPFSCSCIASGIVPAAGEEGHHRVSPERRQTCRGRVVWIWWTSLTFCDSRASCRTA